MSCGGRGSSSGSGGDPCGDSGAGAFVDDCPAAPAAPSGGSGGSGGCGGSGPSRAKPYNSALENQILNASSPISVSEREEITVNGERGIFVNKQEVESFSGPIPLSAYEISSGAPKVIKKSMGAGASSTQVVSVKFLQPPAAGAGDIIVRQGPAKQAPAAPPVIIRQQGCAKGGSKAQCFREKPPCVKPEPPKEICVPGGCVPPPPRKVIIEKVPGAVGGAGKITVERWLAAPGGGERKVIFKKGPGASGGGKVQNVVIEWSQGAGSTKTDVQVGGVQQADPTAYKMKYGSKLKSASELPDFARNIPAPSGKQFAADASGSATHKLTGDVEALRGVDLAKYGLLQYAAQIYAGGVTNSHSNNNCC